MNDIIEIVESPVRCPCCDFVAIYQFPIEKTRIHAASAIGFYIAGLLCFFMGLTLILFEGWKILGLAILGTIMVAITDTFINRVFWGSIKIFSKNICELTIREFTVELRCKNCNCKFQVRKQLQIKREDCTWFNLTQMEG